MSSGHISEIPGNSAAISELLEQLSSQTSLCLAGAGCSAGLYPTWTSLGHTLISACQQRGLTDEGDVTFWSELAVTAPHELFSLVKHRLSEPQFHEHLRNTFSRRILPTGMSYTTLAKKLFSLPFAGFITTNYDPSLIEARMAVRPNSPSTGWGTWADPSVIRSWISGNVFEQQECPIFYAHGYFDRPDTIILTAEEYIKAYSQSMLVDFYNGVLQSRRLLFVGFGFADYVFKTICDRINFRQAGAPRHFALIPLRETEQYTPDRRLFFSNAFGVTPIFYRLNADREHSNAEEILDHLVSTLARSDIEVDRTGSSRTTMKVKFEHETTDDESYTGRSADIERLNAWINDPSVNAIAIIGMGGIGKTSLIGRWLKHFVIKGGVSKIEGVFFWSFYGNRAFSDFVDALCAFLSIPTRNLDLIEKVNRLFLVLLQKRIIVVIDGVEILQERPNTAAYGSFLDPYLANFLRRLSQHNAGLVILTSRFPVSDLSYEVGFGLRTDYITLLNRNEGALLLQKLGLGAQLDVLGELSEQLHGHPLALKLLARVSRHNIVDSRYLREFLREIKIDTDDPLEKKIAKLLSFYETVTTEFERKLLFCISMFSVPISAAILAKVYEKAFNEKLAQSMVISSLSTLVSDGIVIHESEQGEFSMHPIIRFHFRNLGLTVVGSSAVSILTDAPDLPGHVNSVNALRIAEAIQILCDMGKFRLADTMYIQRLRNGGVVRTGGYYDIGYSAACSFVMNQRRATEAAREISARRVSFYYNEAAIFTGICGEISLAEQFFRLAYEIDNRELKDEFYAAISALNIAECAVMQGKMQVALHTIDNGIELSRKGNDVGNLLDCLAFRLRLALICEDFAGARKDYSEAVRLSKTIDNKERVTQCLDTIIVSFLVKYHFLSLRESVEGFGFEYAERSVSDNCNPIDRSIREALKGGMKPNHFEQLITEQERNRNVKALIQLNLLGGVLFRKGDVSFSENLLRDAIDRARSKSLALLLAEGFFIRGVRSAAGHNADRLEAMADIDAASNLATQYGLIALQRRIAIIRDKFGEDPRTALEYFRNAGRDLIKDWRGLRPRWY